MNGSGMQDQLGTSTADQLDDKEAREKKVNG